MTIVIILFSVTAANLVASFQVKTFIFLPFSAAISKRPFLSVATCTCGLLSTNTSAPSTGLPALSTTLPITLPS